MDRRHDPAIARIAGEAVQSMTNKMLTLAQNHSNDCGSAAYINTMSRYAAIKEEEAQKCKDELLVLWTDFFKPQHLEAIPDLHDISEGCQIVQYLQGRSLSWLRTRTDGCNRGYPQHVLE